MSIKTIKTEPRCALITQKQRPCGSYQTCSNILWMLANLVHLAWKLLAKVLRASTKSASTKVVPTRLAFPLWLHSSKLPVDNSFRFIHCYLDPEATQETLKALVRSPVHDRAHQRVMQKLQNKRRCLAFFVCCQPARTPAVLCNTPFLTPSLAGLAEIHA